jgi:hypothetical protein
MKDAPCPAIGRGERALSSRGMREVKTVEEVRPPCSEIVSVLRSEPIYGPSDNTVTIGSSQRQYPAEARVFLKDLLQVQLKSPKTGLRTLEHACSSRGQVEEESVQYKTGKTSDEAACQPLVSLAPSKGGGDRRNKIAQTKGDKERLLERKRPNQARKRRF